MSDPLPLSGASAPPRSSPLPTAVRWAQWLLEARLSDGDFVVDATAGNGYDTLFLAQQVLPQGWVYAFDLQEQAVFSTRQRIASALPPHAQEHIQVIHASHAALSAHLPLDWRGQVRAFMFNLGFLPGGDKGVITQPASTLGALRDASDWLAPDGIITVAVYPGHEGGWQEAEAVEAWMSALPSDQFETQKLGFLNFRKTTPYLMVLRKRTP